MPRGTAHNCSYFILMESVYLRPNIFLGVHVICDQIKIASPNGCPSLWREIGAILLIV